MNLRHRDVIAFSATCLAFVMLAIAAPVIASGNLLAASAVGATPDGFTALAPYRLLDTSTGVGAPMSAVSPWGTVHLQVTGRGGVPVSGVLAVQVNVTVTQPTRSGYLTVYPAGTTRPKTSSLSFSRAGTATKLVLATVGSNGKVNLYNGSGGTIQLIADVSGYTLTATSSPTTTSSPTITSSPTGTSSPTTASGGRWTPAVGGSWQIQFQGTLDTSLNVPTYDIDGFDNTASTVTALRAAGHHAICYISAGSWENWRPDAASYPNSILGNSNGWPGERWVDIRQTSILKAIMDTRLNMCRSKGFQAVDFDNVDGYTNATGLPLTATDQLVFNRMIAAEAHSYGLSVGLKNDLDQIPALVGNYDFAVNEQCHQYNECAALSPFISSGKAVLQIEYQGDPSAICPGSLTSGFATLFKQMDLGAWRQAC